VLYENGRGVPADLAKAQQLYGKAAAMSNLGWMYESGRASLRITPWPCSLQLHPRQIARAD
jgi:TPR repeat protein